MNVTLECEHKLTLSIPPKFGERLWCRSCDDYRAVRLVEQWTLHCRSCKYNKRRVTKSGILRAAETHSQRHGHLVNVKDESGKVRFVTEPDTLPML